jgi:2-desacetyl-2-hydroxyethyl bacteriochlorophyllide A dehydrogenase
VKAIVIEAPHQVALRDLEPPVAGPGEVLVRSHRAGVCRTDLEVLAGTLPERWVRYPCIPGHEWSGTVAAVGDGVREVGAGDRVVCEGIVPCRRCRRCREGATNLCENYDQLGFTRAGGWGELVSVPVHVVHRLPEHVSLDAAVLIEPGSVVLRALERARPAPGDLIGIVGVGTLGALGIQLARTFSPRAVVAYGVRAEELAFARRLGAEHAVDVTRGDPTEETRRLVGEGLDVVIECAGKVAAQETATRLLRQGGRAVLLGLPPADTTLALPGDRLPVNDVELIGSMSYTSAAWGRMVRLVHHRLVDLEPIVTHRFAQAAFADALRLMDAREGTVVKIVLEMPEAHR